MKARTFLSIALFAALLPFTAQAQVANPFGLEVRGGAGIPTGEFGDAVQTGWGLGVNGSYRFTPTIGAYLGYSHNSYGMDISELEDELGFSLTGFDLNAVSSGFEAGLIAFLPGVPTVEPWLRGGVILHRMTFKASGNGASASQSGDYGLGFEVGGGVAVPVTPRISITPGVVYRSYKPKFEGETSDEALTDIGLDVGVRIRF